uniref:Uncharacterized protein n=1 Tax=Rhizophora mucronata TaxID=61149 RepID=A0A2P2NQP7_RHIMU
MYDFLLRGHWVHFQHRKRSSHTLVWNHSSIFGDSNL